MSTATPEPNGKTTDTPYEQEAPPAPVTAPDYGQGRPNPPGSETDSTPPAPDPRGVNPTYTEREAFRSPSGESPTPDATREGR